MKNLKKQAGYSLVELIVAMGIFAVTMTVFTGFFLNLYRLQNSYRATANLQQEARITSEIFTRYLREAETVKFPDASAGPLCPNSPIYLTSPRGVGTDEKIEISLKCDAPSAPATTGTTLSMGMLKSGGTPYTDADYDYAPLTSENVAITSFVVKGPSAVMYPKVMEYDLGLKSRMPVSNVLYGTSLNFKGYINMRNER